VVIPPWRDPKAALRWDEIDPIVSLKQLTGMSTRGVFWTALDRRDAPTAYAALVYDIGLEPEERCSLALALAQNEAATAHPDIQRGCYEIAANVAVAASDLSDLTRARTLLMAARGAAALGRDAQALSYLDQVDVVVRHSDQLALAHRQQLVDELIPLAHRLGCPREDWADLEQQVLAAPGASPRGQPATARVSRPQMPLSSGPVLQAVALRQQMARRVLEGALAQGPVLAQVERDDLTWALQMEDRARASHPGGDNAVAAAQERATWAVLKWRVAHGGYGISLVPEWEARRTEIDAELAAALDALYDALQDRRDTSGQEIALLRIEHGLLGFYPGWPQAEWAAQLDRLDPLKSVYVTTRMERGHAFFVLAGKPPG